MLAGCVAFLLLFAASGAGQEAFGTWKMNATRSTSAGAPQPRALVARFEAHPKGEVLTLDSRPRNGPATTFSSVLYLDGQEREYQGHSCSGTQSSRRLDRRTIEIVYERQDSWTRFIRRRPAQANELILDITEKLSNGRRLERHLILEKHRAN